MQRINYRGNGGSSDEDSDMINMVQKKVFISDQAAWVIASGSTTHVCIERSRFKTEPKSQACFNEWTRGVTSGNVLVHTINGRSGEVEKLWLKNSIFGSANLLSLGVMEKAGWSLSTNSPRNYDRETSLNCGGARLRFAKLGSYYWLKTVNTEGLSGGTAMLTVNADVSLLMHWHERLGHLNVTAIKRVMDMNTVTGMAIPKELFKKRFVCLSCMSGNQKWSMRQEKRSRKVNEGELRAVDVGHLCCGLILTWPEWIQILPVDTRRMFQKNDASTISIKLMTELQREDINLIRLSAMEEASFSIRTGDSFRSDIFVYTGRECSSVKTQWHFGRYGKYDHSRGRFTQQVVAGGAFVHCGHRQYVRYSDKTTSEKLFGKGPDVSKIRVCGSGFINIPKRKTKLSPKAEPV
ncbi:LOW QUALITY PROTEIN: Hypothetical protein PHPALM_3358 [Phytophthora palmivora]|uniref:GAG-pre-integrase domain-containing protein n=1 Tax=Phytophthora palmivora TaxID=4796 RepID=A0A2P4YMQ7_9STRA|nr:LOW QUALITY PROTEIN: Hypothetical protein PHPALM_3358 [Phytophthora palmivora]